jgi:hypothetical protein
MAAVQTYYQADEPNETTPGTVWLRSDGTKAQRDLSGNWIEKGSWVLEDDGLLSKNGGAVVGPITGNHGHAPTDSPAFTTNITLDGEDVPDKPWVTAQIEDMQTALQTYVTEALSVGDTGISIGANLAFGYGIIAHGGTIPLPKYSDDTQATIGQICLLLVGPSTLARASGGEATYWVYETSVDPTTLLVTARTRITSGGGGNNAGVNGTANYSIICKR